MPRYRIMFTKAQRSRYISHLDLSRVFEQACRRCELPLAFSQGFNPHPKISFAVPLALGVSGEREFVDIELTEQMDTDLLVESLNKNLPVGIDVLEARVVSGQQKPLMARVESADYRIECAVDDKVTQDTVEQIIREMLSQPSIMVQREVKGKQRISDIRPGIINLAGHLENGKVILQTELNTGSKGNVRVEDMLKELIKAGLPIDYHCCKVYRAGVYAGSVSGKAELW